jgi:adenosylmethionine---8-amino-7-oxononanoate aminotransferase
MAGTGSTRPSPSTRLCPVSPAPASTPSPDPWAARDAAVVWHGFTQMAAYPDNAPLTVERAEGRELIDVHGRRYFDGISSLWVTTLGHHLPELDAAIVDQLGRVAHSTLLGNGSRVAVEFAEALAAVVPVIDPHVMFASDGAVAVEQALKVAFQYWVNRGEPGHNQFLALGDAYHGDTVGALSLGDGGFGTTIFDPLRFPVVRTPGYAAADWATKMVGCIEAQADSLAAVVIEPLVQGASGILVAEPSDLAAVGRACRALGVLLICDEVATGFGRTGRLFASEWAGPDFRPDILCLGKGITGGYLPLSATVASGAVFEAFNGPDLGESTFYHGHSYGGNALACAVALRHLQLIDEWDVLANVAVVAERLSSRLAASVTGQPGVGEVRQRGLMVGVELDPPKGASRWGRRVCAAAVARGVLLRPLGDVVVVMPPLTTTESEIDRVVEVLAESIKAVWAEDHR